MQTLLGLSVITMGINMSGDNVQTANIYFDRSPKRLPGPSSIKSKTIDRLRDVLGLGMSERFA
jgi:hypothetical protein